MIRLAFAENVLCAVLLTAGLVGCGDDDTDVVAWEDFCPVYQEVDCDARSALLQPCNWPNGPEVPGSCYEEAFCTGASIESACRTSSWHNFCGNRSAAEPTWDAADACLDAVAASDFADPGPVRDHLPACAALCD